MKLTPMTSHRSDGNQPHRFAAVMGPLADHLAFFVFDNGGEPIGVGWTVDYAGRTYPLKPA